jgi:UPF0755 protein
VRKLILAVTVALVALGAGFLVLHQLRAARQQPTPTRSASMVTVREGLSLAQTLALLAQETGIPLADFQAAAADPAALGIGPQWYARTDGKQAAVSSIDGFLFPDTYEVDSSSTAHDILQRMVDQFFVVAQRVQLQSRAAALGMSAYQVLTVASIAQVEGLQVDFGKIARVVYNRLAHGMFLGMDTTAIYWLELRGQPRKPSGELTHAELDDPNNPYNTGVSSAGLPLGPISNPGEAALTAALAPEVGDWLYFTAVDQAGTTRFAVTQSQRCRDIDEAIRNGVLGRSSRC